MKETLGGAIKVATGQSVNKPEILGLFIGFIIWLLIVLFFGKYLWNNLLIKLIPGIKPITSVWQILGLTILISILKC